MTRIASWWCRHFHRSISLPVNGRYHCWVCLRSYTVDWGRR